MLSRESRVESSVNRGRRAFRFERIEAWQQARLPNRNIYGLTPEFLKEEMFGLTSQIRRASVAVSSNIADVCSKNSDTYFAHFLEIAYGSLMEVASQHCLAFDQLHLTERELDFLLEDADFLAAKIVALSKSLGRASRISPKPSTLNPRPSVRS